MQEKVVLFRIVMSKNVTRLKKSKRTILFSQLIARELKIMPEFNCKQFGRRT